MVALSPARGRLLIADEAISDLFSCTLRFKLSAFVSFGWFREPQSVEGVSALLDSPNLLALDAFDNRAGRSPFI